MTYEPYGRIVPERVAARRSRLGLTQSEVTAQVRMLADRGGWPDDSWLSRVERGRLTIALDDAMILARVLETSVAYLCGETPLSIQGWDQISESDRQMIANLIELSELKVIRERRDQTGTE